MYIKINICQIYYYNFAYMFTNNSKLTSVDEEYQKCEINDFFEGTEKRISIHTTNYLMNYSESHWEFLIKKIGCNVINIIQNDFYTFFLLEESSFLLGKNYAMLKTCGKTKPLLFLTDICGAENINILSFKYSHTDFLNPELQDYPYDSIKNEYDVLQQYCVNNCYDDCEIKKQSKWLCCQVGNNHEIFYELICWKFDWNESTHLHLKTILSDHFSSDNIANQLIFDEKCFSPCGYSLNMLCCEQYLTIHVTPQKSCSYFSIETNCHTAMLLFNKITTLISASDFEIHTPNDY